MDVSYAITRELYKELLLCSFDVLTNMKNNIAESMQFKRLTDDDTGTRIGNISVFINCTIKYLYSI